jgi:tRNA-specific 2-thiouridylase
METVFVAMSGGIDSSIAAYLLKNDGFKVVGVTFQLLPDSLRNIQNPKACCSSETIQRAKRVADALSIPHYVINMREEFEEYVIDRFIKDYKIGKTPNPCILCNQFIKFSSFFRKVLSIGGDKIATGHYAIIEKISGSYCLKKAIDIVKDQSYFLYPIQKDQLNRILFPIGGYTKSTIKSLAHEIGWKNPGDYKESQDICFIPGRDYRPFLSKFIQLKKGPVYSVDGKLMGQHEGIHLYTIGQRRGLDIPYREPLYVIEVRLHDNSLIVGPKRHLLKKKLAAKRLNLLSDITHGITGKVRYRQKEQPCQYTAQDNILIVEFDEPIDAITPGQSVVLYHHDIVVGGGVIENSFEDEKLRI